MEDRLESNISVSIELLLFTVNVDGEWEFSQLNFKIKEERIKTGTRAYECKKHITSNVCKLFENLIKMKQRCFIKAKEYHTQ